jgi:hypothetical protein
MQNNKIAAQSGSKDSGLTDNAATFTIALKQSLERTHARKGAMCPRRAVGWFMRGLRLKFQRACHSTREAVEAYVPNASRLQTARQIRLVRNNSGCRNRNRQLKRLL